jgi:hypothetical protein
MNETSATWYDHGHLFVYASDALLSEWKKLGVAHERQSKAEGLHNARGMPDDESIPCSVLGTTGECAARCALGIPQSTDRGEDAGPYQIKTVHKGYQWLAVTKKHLTTTFKNKKSVSHDQVHILVVPCSQNVLCLWGWAYNWELLEAPTQDFGHSGRPPMHALHRTQLRSMTALPGIDASSHRDERKDNE